MLAADLIALLEPSRGPGDRMPARRWARIARAGGPFAVLVVAGCSSLPPRDDLAAMIAQHYASHASEEDGRCASPEIATVTKRKVLASDARSTTLRVRYSYFDPNAAGATDWPRVLQADRPCTGFAERDFTLVSGQLGYQVVEMSGPARDQP
jgi:hypothetical protein